MADFPDYGDRSGSSESLVYQPPDKDGQSPGIGSKVAEAAGSWAGKAFNAASNMGDKMAADKNPQGVSWLMDRVENIETENIKRRAHLDEQEKRINHLLGKVMKEVEANGQLQETIQQGRASAIQQEQNRKKAAQWWGLVRDVTIGGLALAAVIGLRKVSSQLGQMQQMQQMQWQAPAGYQQQLSGGSTQLPWRTRRTMDVPSGD